MSYQRGFATDTAAKNVTGAFMVRVQLFGWRLLVLLVALIVWEVGARTVIDPFWVSQPSLIAKRLWDLGSSGILFVHAGITLWEAALGMALGLPVGVAVGVVLAAWPRFSEVIDPFIMGLYSLPRIALAPLFVIWFGIGLWSKVMLVFSLVVFVFILNTYQGLREVDRDLVSLMRTMRASRLYTLRRVQIPSILPWIIAAFRINVGMALIGAVLGEMLGSNRGLGWYIEFSGGRLDTTGVFTGLIVLMVIALGINEAVKAAEARLLPFNNKL
jgi:NitT/TauT family transport system permease protein